MGGHLARKFRRGSKILSRKQVWPLVHSSRDNKFRSFSSQAHDALFWSKMLKIRGVSLIFSLKFLKSRVVLSQKPPN